ncbi:Copper methylamine oxidase [Diplonema papillatum]|nr:Copper methylamine oxidase [Diplonema papillatum]|eukprot:gene2821-4413_t
MTGSRRVHPLVHPLAPLGVDEIAACIELVRKTKNIHERCRFPIVELREPVKAAVEAFERGGECPRRATVVMVDKDTAETFEGLANLTTGSFDTWKRLPFDKPPYGQAPIMVAEFDAAVEVVTNDPKWREAVKRRGLTDADFEHIQVDPWSFGFWDNDPKYTGKRLLRGVAFYKDKKEDNAYSHPIEGLVAIIDLIENKVIELIDDGRNIPVPKQKHNYDTPSLGKPRPGLKPLHITQPEGVSFEVDGWQVKWQGWEFKVGFTPREGLVLHQIGIRDKGALRPVIHRASVTDMAVPYSDHNVNHYWKCALDGSEYGLGRLANCLELGCDCLGAIRYFDVPAVDDFGKPFVMKNALCLHEEDYGTLWKHYEWRTGVFEMRRSRRLVISFFATVGNYDYGFYWHFYLDGSIQFEAKLTGIVQTAALGDGSAMPKGAGRITEHLYGPSHQHFFGARLHMNVDGGGNSVVEVNYQQTPKAENNKYGTLFGTVATKFERELEACREANGASGRFWKVINPSKKSIAGNPTGYKLVVEHTPTMLALADSTHAKRVGFATKHLWVTPFDEDEMSCAGTYTNQHMGDGVHKWVEKNRSIDNTDVVLWHTFGHTHTCKPEDFPVMPIEYIGFWIKPNNFFDANFAMDLPSGKDLESVSLKGKGGACCGADGMPSQAPSQLTGALMAATVGLSAAYSYFMGNSTT